MLPPPFFFFLVLNYQSTLDPWLAMGQQAFQILGKWKRKAEYLEEYRVLNLPKKSIAFAF